MIDDPTKKPSDERDIGQEWNGTDRAFWARTLMAADEGNAEAQFQLGHAYDNGKFGVPPDSVEAARFFHKAARQGHAEAENALGNCYLFGRGVSQDYDEALKWFRQAAEQGNESAEISIAAAEKAKAAWVRKEAQCKESEKSATDGDAKAQSQRCQEPPE